MNLIDNQVFTIYRDSEFEAFYDVDLKNRWKIILAHIVIHFFPVLIAIIVTQTYSLEIFRYMDNFFQLISLCNCYS
jgi:hypothetical protein